MQVIDKSAEGLKRQFSVVIAADAIEEKVTSRLNEVGRQVRLPGFRPGKVPMNLLRKRFGQAVRSEILERTIDESTQAAFTEKAVKPAMQPKVELVKFEEGQDLEFSVQYEVLPEISSGEFSNLDLTRLVASVSDKEHEEAINGFLRNRRTTEKVDEDRPAKTGDGLMVDFVGRIDGKEFDGGTAKDALVEIGSGQYVPGFEDQLVGAKVGDTVKVNVTFPEDYAASELAGKAAEFDVTVKELHKVTTPPLDDEFAKSMGDENVEALRTRMRKFLQDNYDNASRLRLKRQLLDRLAESHSFAVPEGLVDVEFDAIWRQMERVAKDGQLDPEDEGKTDEELRKEYRDIAERRVRLGLLLSDVGQKNGVSVSQEDLNKAIMQEAVRYPGQETAVIEYYQRNPQALEALRAPIFEDKVVDFIISQAKVTDQAATIEEIMRDPEDDEAKAEQPASDEAAPKKAKKAKSSKSKADAE